MAGYTSLRKGTAARPKAPDDFADAQEFLAHVRESYDDDLSYDKDNRTAADEDLKFFTGDQWDAEAKGRRDRRHKPVITINLLPAYAGQLIGNRRMNEVQVKVLPDNGGTKEIATLREGLMRNIQKVTNAERVYDQTFENQLICGIGNFCVVLEYAADDVFEQDIRFKAVNDALAVVWDRKLVDPTGADADHVFVVDAITRATYKERWPWAQPSDFATEQTLSHGTGWFSGDDVRIVNYWRMRTMPRVLALLQNGGVEDVTDRPEEEWLPLVVVDPRTGAPIVREAERHYAELYVCSGTELLEGPYRLPIKRVPVFRVPGWEVHVGDQRHRWGLIRFLKDPMRLHNYWRSVVAEKLMMSPKAKWIASAQSVQGREDQWRNAHISDDPLLLYDAEVTGKPELVQPAQIEAGLINEAITTKQDMRDVSNMHEASMGQTSNEVSGRGIVARQRVGELGTTLFNDNLNEAIAEAGKVINDLIPIVYDTARIVRVLGEDDAAELVPINDSSNDKSQDITAGKYSVTITTGPSSVTKRLESAESMLNFVNSAPQVAAAVMDLIAEAQDWPKAQEIARRLRLGLPPGMLAEKDMPPEQQQAQQAAAQEQQEQSAMAKARMAAEIREIESKAEEALAKATQAKALAFKAVLDATSRESDVQSKDKERTFKARLETINTAFPAQKGGTE